VTWLDDQDVFVVLASDFGFHSELVDQSAAPHASSWRDERPIMVSS